MIHIFVN